jgi:hypothetical protein
MQLFTELITSILLSILDILIFYNKNIKIFITNISCKLHRKIFYHLANNIKQLKLSQY